MKYLDEQIEITVNNLVTTRSGVYNYIVYRQNQEGSQLLEDAIFYGSVFLESGTTSYTFDITDLVRNDKYNYNRIYSELSTVWAMPAYFVNVTTDESDVSSDTVTVWLGYRYPNYKSYMDCHLWDYRETTEYPKTLIPLQGAHYVGDTIVNKLTPHYPLINTDKFNMRWLQLTNSVYKEGHTNNAQLFRFVVNNSYSKTYIEDNSFIYPISMVNVPLSYLLRDIGTQTPQVYLPTTQATNWNYTGDEQGGMYVNGEFSSDWVSSQSIAFISVDGDNPLAQFNIQPNSSAIEINAPLTDELYNYITGEGINYILFAVTDDITDTNRWKYIWFTIDKNFQRPENGILSMNIPIDIEEDGNGNIYITITTQDLNNSVTITSNIQSNVNFYIEDLSVATFDTCPSRYYLQWVDRMGSFQCQRFNDKVTYSEKFNKEEYENYKHERKLKNITITSKWEINTDWIPEELYPFYESIFISPSLVLYDSYEDKSYNVLVTGDYTEKTFKNQKRLINLTLQLELSKSQNILY